VSYLSEKVADSALNQMPVGYPDDNPKTVLGTSKPSMHAVPPVALLWIGQAMADGERKYGLTNWREKTVSTSVYYDAMMRHLMAWWDGEDVAEDSGLPHLAHVAACVCILLDAQACGSLNDNRPKVKGRTAEVIKALTKS